eukprot:TRINITY_DN7020_c3_g1_i1.p1 TRINITY_DN7020_c3_g1~~TRINITY_DN7020_c3_g1_i1.p1  ORF type:complete len:430 (-),score=70.12 TRINITY_DN7020_c3_g1_i1:469-1758(-)
MSKMSSDPLLPIPKRKNAGGETPSSDKAKKRWAKLKGVYAAVRFAHAAALEMPVVGIDSHLTSTLEDLSPKKKSKEAQMPLLRRASLTPKRMKQIEDQDERTIAGVPLPFARAAAASIFLGVLSVVPYNMVLKSDPGSPLFISFMLHLAIIGKSLPRIGVLIKNRKLPVMYHAAIVVCGCLFTTLKSDAYVRLPASVCMLLSNLRMLLGVVVQYIIFRQSYSVAQLSSVLAVTVGIAWAGQSMKTATAAAAAASGQTDISTDFFIGVLEIFGSSTALALMSSTVKIAFSNFGESAEEQMFVQHLCGLFLVFPTQWEKVGPRFSEWSSRGDSWWLLVNLGASVCSTFVARRAAASMAGRSPSLLMTQLVQTVECFLQLLLVALLRLPPWPPAGFWAGSLVLLIGTLCYLEASQHPDESGGEDQHENSKVR